MIKTKLTHKDRANIQARYNTKFEEYTKLRLDELKEIFDTTKLSLTDKTALQDADLYIRYKKRAELAKQNDEISADIQTDGVPNEA